MVQYPSSSHWPCFVRNCCQSSPILHDGSFISVWKEMKIQSLSASDTLLHRVRQMSAKKIHKRKSSEHTFFIYINYLSYIQLSIYRHMKHKIREKRKSMFILNICHFAGGRKQESREILSKLADSRHTLANCNCTCFKMSFSKLNKESFFFKHTKFALRTPGILWHTCWSVKMYFSKNVKRLTIYTQFNPNLKKSTRF